MPSKCLELMQNGENLPQICMDLHMSIVGSSDPLSELVFIRYVKCLELAVDNRDYSIYRTAVFDSAVLNLVVCTLAEIRLRLGCEVLLNSLQKTQNGVLICTKEERYMKKQKPPIHCGKQMKFLGASMGVKLYWCSSCHYTVKVRA